MVGQEIQYVEAYKGARDIVMIVNYVGLKGIAEKWYHDLILQAPKHAIAPIQFFLFPLLNGGSAYSPYDVNWIPLTSDPMPAALLSNPKIQIPGVLMTIVILLW